MVDFILGRWRIDSVIIRQDKIMLLAKSHSLRRRDVSLRYQGMSLQVTILSDGIRIFDLNTEQWWLRDWVNWMDCD